MNSSNIYYGDIANKIGEFILFSREKEKGETSDNFVEICAQLSDHYDDKFERSLEVSKLRLQVTNVLFLCKISRERRRTFLALNRDFLIYCFLKPTVRSAFNRHSSYRNKSRISSLCADS